jgi:hypothetical protein
MRKLVVERWNVGMLEHWNVGMLKSRKPCDTILVGVGWNVLTFKRANALLTIICR